jgi:hypothetical protein
MASQWKMITPSYRLICTAVFHICQYILQLQIDRYHPILFTSEKAWSPYDESFLLSENSFLPPHHCTLGATSSKEHRSSIPPEILSQRWGTSLEIASKTLQVTTQRGTRNLLSPPRPRTNVYSDTLISDTKSPRGFECAQLFVTDQDFAEVYPMRLKAEAPYKLDLF